MRGRGEEERERNYRRGLPIILMFILTRNPYPSFNLPSSSPMHYDVLVVLVLVVLVVLVVIVICHCRM